MLAVYKVFLRIRLMNWQSICSILGFNHCLTRIWHHIYLLNDLFNYSLISIHIKRYCTLNQSTEELTGIDFMDVYFFLNSIICYFA